MKPASSNRSRAGEPTAAGQDAGAVGDGDRGVEQLADPVARAGGLLREREQEPERQDRPEQDGEQRDEADQAADGEGAGVHRERAADQDDRQRDLRVELEDAPQQRQRADLVELQPPQPGGLGVVAVEHQPAAAERLDHPDALHRLLDVGGQLALLVLHQPGLDVVPLLPAQAEQRQRDGGDEHGQAQRPVGDHQQHEDDGADDQVDGQEHRGEAHEAPDGRDVGGRAGEQLPGGPPVVEGDRQPLQPGVEGVAEVALDLQAAAVHRPAAEEEQRGLGDPEDQREADQRHQPGAVAVGDRPVDDGRRHQRDGQLGEAGQQRAGEGEHHQAAVRAGERHQPEQRRQPAPVVGGGVRGRAGCGVHDDPRLGRRY